MDKSLLSADRTIPTPPFYFFFPVEFSWLAVSEETTFAVFLLTPSRRLIDLLSLDTFMA